MNPQPGICDILFLDFFLNGLTRGTRSDWQQQFIRIPRNERGLNPQAQHIQVAQDSQTMESVQPPAWTPAAFQLLLFHLLYCAVLEPHLKIENNAIFSPNNSIK